MWGAVCLVQEDLVASFPNHSGHCQLQRLPGPLPLTNQLKSDLTWLVSEELIPKRQDIPAALTDSDRSCNDGVRSGMGHHTLDPVMRRSPTALLPVTEEVSWMNYRVEQVDEISDFRYIQTQKNPH